MDAFTCQFSGATWDPVCYDAANWKLEPRRLADERGRVGQKGKAIVMERFMVNKSMSEALRRIVQV
jgi:hypothetical protein